MAIKGLKSKANGIDVLNAVRNSLPPTYQNRIPEATKDNIREYGNALKNFPVIMNAFVDVLINKIGLTVIKNKSYTNPLKMFQRGDLEVGEVIEEIFVDVVKAKVYTPEAPANNLGDVFQINKPNVMARYHVVNSQLVYPITINKAELLRAFRSVAYFEEFVSKIFESVYTSEELDEFLQTKSLIQNYMTAPENGVSVNRFYNVKIDDVTDEASAKAFARIIRKYSNDLMFMKNKFNYAGVTTHTPKEDQVLIIDTDVDAWLDVEVLAYAFNMNKANPEDVLGKKLVLDDFGDETDTETKALLVDRDWFMIYNQLYEIQEQDNALHLYFNRFLHVWKCYSTSQFANTIRFTTGDVTPDVISVEIKPTTADIQKNTSEQLEAIVQVTNGASAEVVWTIDASTTPTSVETTISESGLLSIGADETLKSIKVTATSKAKSSVNTTNEYTIISGVIE